MNDDRRLSVDAGASNAVRPRTSRPPGGDPRALAAIVALLLLLSPAARADLSSAQDKPRTRVVPCVSADCHATLASRKVKHPATIECQMCHTYASPEQHLFTLKSAKREICSPCHALPQKVVMHQPVAQGECTSCHDPHGTDFPAMLIAEPGQDLCITCHKEDYSAKAYVHGPVAIGACTVCHESHSSAQDNLLRARPERLCVECHAEMNPTEAQARHKHKPLEQGCTTCHDPHASPAKYQLHKPVRELCFSCHTGVKNSVDSAHVVHGPAGEEAGCAQCHNPHFTQLPRLQREPQPDVCLRCHNQPLKANDGHMLPNMAEVLADNPDHHGPIREGACTTCHQPHAGERFGMLFQAYPKEFYSSYKPENYQLCFSCHMSDLVKQASGAGLTGFRDGDLNLHWLHVNREKGRTCRACHEVHASKRPFHIREKVPFGPNQWMLPIRYEESDNGGQCLPGCHRERTYDRTRERSAQGTDLAMIKESAK